MSLRETAVLAVLLLNAVPVVSAYSRHRFGIFWWVTFAASLAMSVFLAVLWALVALRSAPGTLEWAQGLLACGVPVLLTGYLFSGLVGRGDPLHAVRSRVIPLSVVLGLGALTLVFIRDPALVSDYRWRAGSGIIVLGALGKAYLCLLLVGAALVGRNLEAAFRRAAGEVRSRLHPVVLGLFGVLGFLVYVLTTGLVYGEVDLDNLVALALPLAVADLVTGYAFLRGTLTDSGLSRNVVYTSFTTLVAVLYFLAMGAAAQLATLTGWTPGHVVTVSFVFLVVLVALLFFFSHSFKRSLRRFIDRHFYVNRHDYRSHWSRLAGDLDPSRGLEGVLESAERLLLEVFQADEVSVALRDRTAGGFRVRRGRGAGLPGLLLEETGPLVRELEEHRQPILLDGSRNAHPRAARFREGEPWCAHAASELLAPMLSGEDLLGVIGLSRREGDPFTFEDLDLLEHTGTQIAAVLRGAEWGQELAEVRETELLASWSNMILHDLKNYLSPLRMIVRNMRDHLGNPEFQEEAIEDISGVTDRMEGLMQRLTDLRTGRPGARQLVRLDGLVAEVLAALKVDRRPGLEVEATLGSRVAVEGDGEMLRRVVENMITNAVDAMDGGGRLTVVTESLPAGGNGRDALVLRIADTGPGMDPAFVRERLFRPFATTKKRGFGLGLYQSQGIVRSHGGRIRVDSRPGEGTVFTVILPGVPAEAEHANRAGAEPAVRES